MEYNNSFISISELVAVEHLLELSRRGLLLYMMKIYKM